MQAPGSLMISLDPSPQPNQQDGRLSTLAVQFHVVSNSEAQEVD
jgi:hypothetical protein